MSSHACCLLSLRPYFYIQQLVLQLPCLLFAKLEALLPCLSSGIQAALLVGCLLSMSQAFKPNIPAYDLDKLLSAVLPAVILLQSCCCKAFCPPLRGRMMLIA